MHFQVKSSLANEFARSFYDKLAQRTGIEVAMHAARRHVYVGGVQGEVGRGAFGLPVLYLRDSGTLLTPLEVPTATVRAVVESTASEPSRPGLREKLRDDEKVHAHPERSDADSWRDASRTWLDDTDWQADKALAPEYRERR
jgi:hypothetical protein